MAKKILRGTDSLTLFKEGVKSTYPIADKNPISQSYAIEEGERITKPAFREDDEAFFFPWRHLSATIVGEHTWKATDFTKKNVLKNSTKLLNNVPAYLNHFMYVGNAIGTVINPRYSKAFTNQQGIEIPAGIDAEFAVLKNVKRNADIIEFLKSEYNPYRDASVKIYFKWEASHEFESEWEFWDLLGSVIIDDSGNESMVRRIATEIIEYGESSLVAAGADEFAVQHNDNGDIVGFNTVSRNDIIGSCSKYNDPLNQEYFDSKKFFIIDCVNDSKSLSLSQTENKKNSMNEILKFIGEKIGKGPSDLHLSDVEKYFSENKTKSDYDSVVDELGIKKNEVSDLKVKLDASESKVTKLNASIEENKAKVAYADSKRGELVAQAIRLATASAGGNLSDKVKAQIENDDADILEEKIIAFGGNVAGKFGSTCSDCGSNKIDFKSSQSKSDPDPDEVYNHYPTSL